MCELCIRWWYPQTLREDDCLSLQAGVFGPLGKVILAVGMTITAVLTQKISRRVPATEAVKSSDMVRVRSVVWMQWLMLGASCGRAVVVGGSWEKRRERTDARVTPGRIVPSSGVVTTSRSAREQVNIERKKYG